MNKEELMRKLNLTEKEAEELIEYDKAMDKGEPSCFDLDDEHQKVAKEMTNMETHKKKNKEEKPQENTDKSLIIDEIVTFLEQNDTLFASNISVINAERELLFDYNGNTYQMILIQKRGGKKS